MGPDVPGQPGRDPCLLSHITRGLGSVQSGRVDRADTTSCRTCKGTATPTQMTGSQSRLPPGSRPPDQPTEQLTEARPPANTHGSCQLSFRETTTSFRKGCVCPINWGRVYPGDKCKHSPCDP